MHTKSACGRADNSGEWFIKRRLSPVEMHSIVDGVDSKRNHELIKQDGKIEFRRNGHELLKR